MRPTLALDVAVRRTAMVGWVGVDLFFALSGFLITGILVDAKGEPHYFRNFYARRTLRIFPLYYGFLIGFFLVLPHLVWPGPGFDELQRGQLWYRAYLVNVDVALHGWPGMSYLGHFWSLAVEEQFYLIWPWIIFLFSRRWAMRVCLLFVAGALVSRVLFVAGGFPHAACVLTPSRMDALAIGALLALWARGPGSLRRALPVARAVQWSCAAALAADSLWCGKLTSESREIGTVGLSVIAVMFGASLILALAAQPGSRTSRWLCSPLLTFFGRYSYALYVFHHPVTLFLTKRGIFSARSLPEVLGSQLVGQAAYLVVATAISVGLALTSRHLLEAPFLRLKRFFAYRP